MIRKGWNHPSTINRALDRFKKNCSHTFGAVEADPVRCELGTCGFMGLGASKLTATSFVETL